MANNASGSLNSLTATGFSAAYLTASTGVGVAASASASVLVDVVLYQPLNAACTASGQLLYDAAAESAVGIAASADTTLVFEALMMSLVSIGLVLPSDICEMWVVNADSAATSRYTNFEFNSFGELNGELLGVKADGVYVLRKDVNDEGVDVQCMVDLGRFDFGSSALKRLPNVYVGTSNDGYLYLKVIADDAEYIYKSRSTRENLMTQRFDLGRGLRSRYFDFELYGDGATFSISSVEFATVPTNRRI